MVPITLMTAIKSLKLYINQSILIKISEKFYKNNYWHPNSRSCDNKRVFSPINTIYRYIEENKDYDHLFEGFLHIKHIGLIEPRKLPFIPTDIPTFVLKCWRSNEHILYIKDTNVTLGEISINKFYDFIKYDKIPALIILPYICEPQVFNLLINYKDGANLKVIQHFFSAIEFILFNKMELPAELNAIIYDKYLASTYHFFGKIKSITDNEVDWEPEEELNSIVRKKLLSFITDESKNEILLYQSYRTWIDKAMKTVKVLGFKEYREQHDLRRYNKDEIKHGRKTIKYVLNRVFGRVFLDYAIRQQLITALGKCERLKESEMISQFEFIKNNSAVVDIKPYHKSKAEPLKSHSALVDIKPYHESKTESFKSLGEFTEFCFFRYRAEEGLGVTDYSPIKKKGFTTCPVKKDAKSRIKDALIANLKPCELQTSTLKKSAFIIDFDEESLEKQFRERRQYIKKAVEERLGKLSPQQQESIINAIQQSKGLKKAELKRNIKLALQKPYC